MLAGRSLRISACSPELETGGFSYLRYFETFPARDLAVNGHLHRWSFGIEHIGERPDVILICCHGADLSSVIDKARRRHPPAFIVAWLWDNHVGRDTNMKTAAAADGFFISHAFAAPAYGSLKPRCLGHLPACCAQFSRLDIETVFAQTSTRSDALLATYVDYPAHETRSAFLRRLSAEIPCSNVRLMPQGDRHAYFDMTKRDQLREWCGHKTSVVVPLNADLSTRFFDALACGQIPIVSSAVLDLDRVISPEWRAKLPVIRFRENDFASLREAHGRAVAAFDAAGQDGACARHRFALEHHLLEARIATAIAMLQQGSMNQDETKLREATRLHHAGRLDEAGLLYEAILTTGNRNFDALHQLGILRYQQARHQQAQALLEQALALNPESSPAWCNKGLVLQALGRPGEALASYDRAIGLGSGHAEIHNNRGNVLFELGRPQEALAAHEEALRLNPHSALAYNNRANVLRHVGRLAEALASYEQAIWLKPDYVEAHVNRAVVLVAVGRAEEAITSYQRIIALRPADAELHVGLSRVLMSLNRLEEAFASCNQAIALKPDHAEAHRNRGNLLTTVRRHAEALASFDKVLALIPGDLDAHIRRAFVLLALQRPAEALASYEHVYAANPGHALAFGGIANAALECCDWRRTEEIAPQLPQRVADGRFVIEPLTVLGYDCSAGAQFECARHFARFRVPTLPQPLRPRVPYRHDKIRLAYLSADFRRHPVSYQITELIEVHDRGRFEVIGVSFGPDDGTPARKRIAAAFDDFIDVRNVSDREVASIMRRREVDIAVDLMGYTTSERVGILAHRPAPVQVQYLGFAGTMGTDFIDYVIADPLILPFDQQAHWAEKIVHLPECYLVNDRKRAIAREPVSREAAGLPETGFVFCCFNTTRKITAAVFDVWMRLLGKIAGSVLWLARDNDEAQRNLRREAQARGIDPARLVFMERVTSSEQHLARHALADLLLDTLPYGAHSTGAAALWAGLPFITCLGATMQSRIGASILRAAGLPELVTHSLDEYEQLAARLAADPSELATIRCKLQTNRLACPLFDTDRFRRHIEAAYLRMWEQHRQGCGPEAFAVSALPASMDERGA
ncbi:MAG: tetratricopeptide repeat protein [Hyphomicrobiales bacterium]|nr:tetratricopeptide repeat protein [Hyphomicrobiales bacterium]MBV8825818.1 tetratricopeptide repeat protein [Hyphomicrobiales bacterium]